MRRAAFVSSFLLPLVEGGEVHVGAPLGPRGAGRMLTEEVGRDAGAAAAAEGRLAEARLAVAAELQVSPHAPILDGEALRLAVAVHDLLFLFHPATGTLATRTEGVRRVASGATALARLPGTADPDVLVARHTVLHRFPSLSRTDVRIRYWAGHAEFHGQEPPERMRAWPRLRRVNEERWKVNCLTEAAGDVGGGADVLRALLSSSPLTDLLHPLRLEPRLDFASLSGALASAGVCRMVAYRYLEEGPSAVGGAVAQAVISHLSSKEGGVSAAFVLNFVCHLHLCLLLAPNRGEPQVELVRVAARGDVLLRDFCGLYAATAKVAPDCARPADLAGDPRLVRLAGEHRVACAEVCGATRMRELVALVARSLGYSDTLAASHPASDGRARPAGPLG